MSGAREVLDAIDRALDDRTVSGDAMRWTPQQEADRRRILARETARRTRVTVPPLLVDPERAAAASRRAQEQFAALLDALRPVFATLGQAMQQSGIAVEAALREAVEAQRRRDANLPIAAPLPPPPGLRDTDPRAHALAALRARGTGPDRQVQHHKRPREHQ